VKRATRIASVIVALSCPAFCRVEYSRDLDQKLPIEAGKTISIEHSLGDIAVHTHADRTVTIHAEIHTSGGSKEDAEQFAKSVEVLADSSSSGVSIRTRYPKGPRDVSYYVRYEITIPQDSPLAIRNSFSSVSVDGTRANVNVTTSHGSITFHDGRGKERFESAFGSIDLSGNVGDVEIENTNGAVRAADIDGVLSVTDKFGEVNVKRVSGIVDVSNKYGAIRISQTRGADVKTSFGSVKLEAVSGPVEVEDQYGSVDVSGIVQSDCRPVSIRTSFSSIRVGLGGQLDYKVSAKTSFAHIHSDFPLSVTAGRADESVSGMIGAGKCEVTLSNSYGPITIVKAGN